MKVAILIAATGRYIEYVVPLIRSMEQYFLPNTEKKYVIFSDTSIELALDVLIGKVYVLYELTPHLPWPLSTMMRYHFYNDFLKNYREYFKEVDYVFCTDADVLFSSPIIPEEVCHHLVGVRHSGFALAEEEQFPYEIREESACAVRLKEMNNYYYGGSFVGGETKYFMDLCKAISGMISEDLKNHIIPIWHDESDLNKYFSEHVPVMLPPTFHFQEGNTNLLQVWKDEGLVGKDAKPKIIVLSKGTKEEKEAMRL